MLAWLTKNSIPSGRVNYVLALPDDETWRADFLGAFFLLTQPENWEEEQSLTAQDMADEWERIFTDFNEGVFAMIPVGCYLPFGGSSPPGGWLLCDGQAVSRSTYSDLFAVIGTSFGSGDGTTTFNVPNLKGKVPVGLDSSQAEFDVLGETGGEKNHTLSTAEMPVHTHVQDQHTHVQNQHTHVQNQHTHVQNEHDHVVFGSSFAPLTGTGRILQLASGNSNAISQGTVATNQNTTPTNQNTTPTNQNTTPTNQSAGGGESHNNLQPYLVTNYIIRY